MSTIDTPRTDELIAANDGVLCRNQWVSADFARQLERELAAKEEELAKVRESADRQRSGDSQYCADILHKNALVYQELHTHRAALVEAQEALQMLVQWSKTILPSSPHPFLNNRAIRVAESSLARIAALLKEEAK